MNTQDIISNEQLASLERIAAIIAKSGMGGFKTPEQATVALLLALAEGIPPGRIIHEYHVINGRLSLRSECMLARFQNAGGAIQYIDRNPACVSISASHPKGGSLTVTWTMTRAREAGLTSNPTWQKHPTAMLAARAIAEAVRAVYPACLSGILAEEEAEEIAGTASDTPGGNGSSPRGNGRSPKRNCDLAGPSPGTPVSPLAPVSLASVSLDTPPTPRTANDLGRGRQRHAASDVQPPQKEGLPHPDGAPAPAVRAEEPLLVDFEITHPLDAALAGLNQEKLTTFLLKQGFIKPGQDYKWCGPQATSRILKQLPSFLKAAGFEEELVP